MAQNEIGVEAFQTFGGQIQHSAIERLVRWGNVPGDWDALRRSLLDAGTNIWSLLFQAIVMAAAVVAVARDRRARVVLSEGFTPAGKTGP
ncbi:hypothetical protein RFM41_06695 [Mesorhizobium sp. VK25A]|uniref:Uncharacterized protein n=1 Tax=Mesorhizobium vachelliae TaxID=3072309 RepID=A0ABU5A2S6_9HYPH|nr:MULTISPECIES: hypothetical protein [unclassified Mesorhizobium]MDX8530829.1 hypothetical protein [Mesorhizobium sp. VK25D]MDX8543420.1 hypothetical protein [Mesorhizobium sp. VK25A]